MKYKDGRFNLKELFRGTFNRLSTISSFNDLSTKLLRQKRFRWIKKETKKRRREKIKKKRGKEKIGRRFRGIPSRSTASRREASYHHVSKYNVVIKSAAADKTVTREMARGRKATGRG